MDRVLSKAICKYGIDKQSAVAIEELSELQKEVCKALRGQLNKDNMVEEMADVWIVIEQLKMIYNITDEDVRKEVHKKIHRLKERLECF